MLEYSSTPLLAATANWPHSTLRIGIFFHSFLDAHQHMSKPSVLVQILQGTDAKMRLYVQETYLLQEVTVRRN